MKEWSKADVQKARENAGFAFGPQFDLIMKAWSSGTEALSLICPTEEITHASAYVLHPSVIDASLQTTLLLESTTGTLVPKKITHINILQKTTCIEQFYAHAKLVDSGKESTYNITLMDGYGRVLMTIDKFVVEEISSDEEKVTFDNAVFTFGWQQLASTSSKAYEDYVCLILRDQSKFATHFTTHITQCKSIDFVDKQDTSDRSHAAFSHALDEVLGKIKPSEKLLLINFWPVDANKLDVDVRNFDIAHSLAFESCLFVSQELLKREAFLKQIQLVFVTSGVIIVPHLRRSSTDAFPWSASVFGFRRSFSEEITVPTASVIDLPANPSDEDFLAMAKDVEQTVLEEEIVYRNGVRYVNRIKKFDPGESKLTIPESPFWKDGTRKPVKLARKSGQWFLQKGSKGTFKNIEIYFACPILHKHWQDLKKNDRISIAGKLSNGPEKSRDSLVVGICKVDDLGSYVAAEKLCFSNVKANLTAQQAASICFPMAMSYHILANILFDIKGEKKVLVYHQSEEICVVFACVAASMDKNVVCLVGNQSNKDEMKRFGQFLLITEDEITKNQPKDVTCGTFDAVCFLSRARTGVTRQILKHVKPGATVITCALNEEKSFMSNSYALAYMKDVRFILTSLQDITESSVDFSKLLDSCYVVLQSKGLWNILLDIPQRASSIYDVMQRRDESNNRCMPEVERKENWVLKTISVKPETVPEQVDFYSLPLDNNGLKDDRTYVVIGGVRGFGFEVARWMVENGAKTVMCTARSAPCKEKIMEVQKLEQKTGSRILLRQADVTSWEEMNAIKSELESLPEVAGIVFTAMILEDQLVKKADMKTCRIVVGTKVKGKSFLWHFTLLKSKNLYLSTLLKNGLYQT